MNKGLRQGMPVKKCVAAMVCILVWLFFILTGDIHYTTNDDTHLNLIAAGAYGPDTQYLIHIHILLGFLIKGLYAVLPQVNCYLWFFLVMNLLGILAVVLPVTERLKTYQAAALSLSLTILLSPDLILDLQYTKNAAWYAAAGSGLFLWNCLTKEDLKRRYVAAAAFLALSFAVRPHSAALVMPFFLMAVTVVFLRREGTKQGVKRMLRAIAPAAVLILLVMGINTLAYARTQEWRDYREWNAISTQMRDFGRYSYADNREALEAAGFTEQEFMLLDHLIFADPEGFPVERMREIEAIGKQSETLSGKISPRILFHSMEFLREALATRSLPAVCLMLVMTAFLAGGMTGKIVSAGSAVLLFAEYYYFTYLDRPMWRAGYAAFIVTALLSALIVCAERVPARMPEEPEGEDSRALLLLHYGGTCALLLIFFLITLSKASDKTLMQQDKDVTDTVVTTISEDTEHFYLAGSDHYWTGLCGAKNIFAIDTRYAGLYHNVCLAGTWQIPSPIGLYYAHTHGITSPIRQLTDENVYFVGTGEIVGYLLEYLNEKNDLEVFVAQKETLDDVAVWDFFEGEWIDGKMQRVQR